MEKKPIYEESFIQRKGVKLHYLDWGGSGQPLVLIHGLGDSPYIFEDIASDLKKILESLLIQDADIANR